jgi:hypothetical protein
MGVGPKTCDKTYICIQIRSITYESVKSVTAAAIMVTGKELKFEKK